MNLFLNVILMVCKICEKRILLCDHEQCDLLLTGLLIGVKTILFLLTQDCENCGSSEVTSYRGGSVLEIHER